MKTVERRSMWHHAAFSAVLCALMITVVVVKHNMPALVVALCLAAYIAGNTVLHYRRKDFRTETLYEYLLVSIAVFIVLVGALRH